MGNSRSQFQQRFYEIYSFVQLISYSHFGTVKIYRKNRVKYDYMMIIDRPINQIFLRGGQLAERGLADIEERIRLIRHYQQDLTVKIEHYRFMQQQPMQCSPAMLRMYVDYHNHTLDDYLSLIRVKGSAVSFPELVYLMRSLVQAILLLRKMTIDDYELTCKEVFVSIDGYVMLSPVYFLCQSLEAHGNCEAIREVDKEYVKYPLSASKSVGNGRHDNKCVDARQLSDLRIIFLEIFQYIDRACEKEIIQLYRLLQYSTALDQLQAELPETNCVALFVQQFYQAITQPLQLGNENGIGK